MTNFVGQQLIKTGWVQGTYLFCKDLPSDFYQICWASSKELHENLESQLKDARNILILISQDCDIAAKSESEKSIEFVIARKPKKNNPPHFLNLDARSSRFLELKLSDNFWYKAEAAKIIQIVKEDFFRQGLSPQNLDQEQIDVLKRWRANRYVRTGLPDKFNEKIKPLIEQHIFDTGLEDAGSLYINLEPSSESENYSVRLFALHRKGSSPETFDGLDEKMQEIIEKINDIEGLMCPFIEGEENEEFETIRPAMRRDEVNMEQLDYFVRWNFDYLSLSNADNEGIDNDV